MAEKPQFNPGVQEGGEKALDALREAYMDKIAPLLGKHELEDAVDDAERNLGRSSRRAPGYDSYTPRRYTDQVGNLLIPERPTFEPDNDLVYTSGQKAKRATEEQDPPTTKEKVLYTFGYPLRKIGQVVGVDAVLRVNRQRKKEQHEREPMVNWGSVMVAPFGEIAFPSLARAVLDMDGFDGIRPGKDIPDDNEAGAVCGGLLDIVGWGVSIWGAVHLVQAGLLVALGISNVPGIVVGLVALSIAKLSVNGIEHMVTDGGRLISRTVQKNFSKNETPHKPRWEDVY